MGQRDAQASDGVPPARSRQLGLGRRAIDPRTGVVPMTRAVPLGSRWMVLATASCSLKIFADELFDQIRW